MRIHIESELSEMADMTISQLRQRYLEIFGETTNSRNKPWLSRRIIWQQQANLEGPLSQRAKLKAKELADERFLDGKLPQIPRVKPSNPSRDPRLPKSGSQITRTYKGQQILVTVLEHDFLFNDQRYGSLSAVAKAVTGSHWNGFSFFGLTRKEKS